MSSFEEQIKKLSDKEDIAALTALVPEILKTQDLEQIKTLGEAIESVLQIWEYDFYCKKMGDPGKWPFLDGIAAVEKLSGQNLSVQKANYFSLQADYQFDQGDAEKAFKFAKQSETLYLQVLQEDPRAELAHRNLIQLLSHFPVDSRQEKADYWRRAYTLVNEALARFGTPIFYRIKLSLLYDHPNRPEDLSQERSNVFQEILKKSKADPVFAFGVADWYHRKNPSIEDLNLKANLDEEFLQILPEAEKMSSDVGYELVQAGHLFARTGKYFRDTKILTAAESFFKKARLQPRAFPLISVYIAECEQARAEIYLDQGDAAEAQRLRDKIRDDYFAHWRSHAEDVSYLSHALDYLGDLAKEIRDENEQKDWYAKLKPLALAAEKRGRGAYWFPYQHLICICIAARDFDEAKLWLGRAYLAMSLLIEKNLRKLADDFRPPELEEMSRFLAPLIKKIDELPADPVWRGGFPWKDLEAMDLVEIENRLKKIDLLSGRAD